MGRAIFVALGLVISVLARFGQSGESGAEGRLPRRASHCLVHSRNRAVDNILGGAIGISSRENPIFREESVGQPPRWRRRTLMIVPPVNGKWYPFSPTACSGIVCIIMRHPYPDIDAHSELAGRTSPPSCKQLHQLIQILVPILERLYRPRARLCHAPGCRTCRRQAQSARRCGIPTLRRNRPSVAPADITGN